VIQQKLLNKHMQERSTPPCSAGKQEHGEKDCNVFLNKEAVPGAAILKVKP